ncbi:Nuclear aminoacylation-dependent tRNA export pathway component [Malassezia sp. CBS 17886]|nr:Nuclear aminoacylation-dependent tRNA export pathway component [Malassezia sp. CBS 17886]
MDFLRSLSSTLTRAGPLPDYVVGDEVAAFRGWSLWTLHDGARRDDGSTVSIFALDATHAPPAHAAMARNAVKRLRSLRHPHVLAFLDSADVHGVLYVVTEPVTPLAALLADGRAAPDAAAAAWGLSHVADALAFLHTQASLLHGNVHPGSIFVSEAHEWRLGGFETLCAPSDERLFLQQYGGQAPRASQYAPPEVGQQGWSAAADGPLHAPDSYSLSAAAAEVFLGAVPTNMAAFPAGSMPPALHGLLRRMAAANPRVRPAPRALLEHSATGFLAGNPYVHADEVLDALRVAPGAQKRALLDTLLQEGPPLMQPYLQHRVLPILVEALETKPATPDLAGVDLSARVLLPHMLKIAHGLPAPAWKRRMAAAVRAALAAQYPPLRAAALQGLALYREYYDARAASTTLWPLLSACFDDPAPAVRAALLAQILPLVPEFSERIRNNELLRQLAKTQVAPQPPLRIETTVVLSRLAPHLSAATRVNVLVPAFARSLKDPYEQARLAGVHAFMDNRVSLDADAIARHAIPALAPCLVDKNRDVRDAAMRVLEVYLDTVRTATASLDSVSTPLPAETPHADGAQTQDHVRGDGAHTHGDDPRASFSHFLTATAGSAAVKLGGWAIAQIDADERADGGASEERGGESMSLNTSAAPGVRLSQAIRGDASAKLSMSGYEPASLAGAWQAEGLENGDVDRDRTRGTHAEARAPASGARPAGAAAHRAAQSGMPHPAQATARAASPAKPAVAAEVQAAGVQAAAVPDASAVAPAGAPPPSTSKEDRMAQVQKLREQRLAVRVQCAERVLTAQRKAAAQKATAGG